MNCPFYGRHLVMASPFWLINQNGNQCALVTTAYSPCAMERDGATPDWKTCPRVGDIVVSFGDSRPGSDLPAIPLIPEADDAEPR